MITAIFSHSVSTNACIQNHIQSHAFRIKIIKINQSVKFVDWWFFALLLIYISSAVHNWWWCENNRNLKHCFMELNCDAEKNNRCSWLWKFRIQNNRNVLKKVHRLQTISNFSYWYHVLRNRKTSTKNYELALHSKWIRFIGKWMRFNILGVLNIETKQTEKRQKYKRNLT